MRVESITIRKFKAIDELVLPLKRINVLAGGNNAGKSCALQAIHVAVALAQSAKAELAANFAPEKLRYVPTDLFLDLKHRDRLSEQGAPISIEFSVEDGGDLSSFTVPLKRGRNSTISTVAPWQLNTGVGALLASSDRPFSVYVPGLSGIPSRETYQGRLVVDRGAVRGDANLYLRNVLYRLFKDPVKKAKFQERLAKLFPGLSLLAEQFDESKHEHIVIEYNSNGVVRPIDMIGTGALQAIQILGYVSFYQPSLLLLDEPDAHLHPDNQLKLVEALDILTREDDLQIILATHSRHLLQAVSNLGDACSFHLRNGALVGTDPDLSQLLVDLGAVDQYDVLSLRDKEWLILGEDENVTKEGDHPLKILLQACGANVDRSIFMSFKGCTEIRSVALLAAFCAAHHPLVKILVHRDADFMTPEEIDELVKKPFQTMANVKVYVTDGSDLESYFVKPEHISEVCQIALDLTQELILEVANAEHNRFVTRFNDKRTALHKQYGRNKPLLATDQIRSNEVPLPESQRVGKDMLKAIEAKLRERQLLAGNAKLVRASQSLNVAGLVEIFG
ncbi:AAA family ATPase [Xanthomonas translucens]|uniref:AAA family ATPase n=1 Tax=Xanthomonas campestris pv. translucens TaxID=343 RepID=UPI0009BC8A40|nr:ATP-binding protein [Xanthomonas translucens]